MRVRLSGSTITAHGDNLGAPYVEFPGNEPLGFSTDWTVSGSAPHRKLLDPHGHEYSVELPTQTAPGGGSGVTVDNGVDAPAAVTTLNVPGADVSTPGQATLIQTLLRTFTLNFDDAGFTDPFGSAIVLWTPAAGDIILDLWCVPTIQFAGADKAVLYVGGNVWFDALIAAVSDNNDTPDLIAIAPPNPSTDFGTGQSASNSTLDARASQLSMPASSGPSANNPIRFVRGLPALVNANGTAVVAGVTVTNGPLTAGQIKVYALTATPA